MNRVALWILVSALAAAVFGWQSYRAWTGPLLAGEEAYGGETFPLPVLSPSKGRSGTASYLGAGISTVTARPLFRPDRRPYQGESVVESLRNHEAELSQYTVLGVLMTGDEKKAIVVAKGAGPGERWEVGVGDSLSGFTVKEVGEDGLTLTADGREFTLPLYAGGPKAVGRSPLRTEVAPKPSPAPARPPAGVRTAPKTGEASPPAAVAPPATPQPRVAPYPRPRRAYPRRSTPGLR